MRGVTLIDRTCGFNLLGDLRKDHGAESVPAFLVELSSRYVIGRGLEESSNVAEIAQFGP
jgi:hypothetical protein